MKLKPTPLYLLSFFSLVFLLHELHDWGHVIITGSLCHCWGSRVFDDWVACSSCPPAGHPQVLGLLFGALLMYIAIWTGWVLMYPGNSLRRKSLGFSLLFAALPFMRIWHACMRDGDETMALRAFFQHPRGNGHYLMLVAGLLIVLLLTLPPLVRAFMLLPGWKLKLLVFPAFLLLPGAIDRFVVHDQMNKLMNGGFLQQGIMRGVPLLVMVWLVLLLVVYLLTRWSLPLGLDYKETLDL